MTRPRDDERTTRKPLALWDRSKLLLLIGLLFGFSVWSKFDEFSPVIGWRDATDETVRARWWLLALAGLELVRQLHYLVAEHWAAYHQLWSQRVFGGFDRRVGKMNDWTRFRIARVLRLLFLLAALAIVLGAIYHLPPLEALLRFPTAVWDFLPLLLQGIFLMLFAVLQFVAIFWFLSRGGTETYFPDDVKTRFTDVWGQDAVLERVKENMVFLEDPESIEKRGGFVPSGILLWGPPGTGKTLMAEAVAGETGKPFVFVEPSAFINMFFGVGPLKVKALFRKLRKLALRYGGVIVFFDEADALGNRGLSTQGGFGGAWQPPSPWAATSQCGAMAYVRPETAGLVLRGAGPETEPSTGQPRRFVVGAGMGGGGMGTLQVLLSELSGLQKPRGFLNRVVRRALGMRPKAPPKYRILVIMATNTPQALDEALLRPGRIDRMYRVGYPSKEGRVRTYEGYFAKVAHDLTPENIDKLATITPYATGASIKDLVNEALVCAIKDGRDTITWPDVVRARLLKRLGPPEDVEYIEREQHAIAIHEACHAVAQLRLQKHQGIDVATIEKGQSYLGMVSPIPLEEQFTSWRSEYEAEIMVFLASLAGERMFFGGDNSSGVSGDLQAATSLSLYMEGMWGMGATIGSRAAGLGAAQMTVADGVSRNVLETGLGERAEARLAELYAAAESLLAQNRYEVLAVAHALQVHKTITGEDVEAIISGGVGPLVDGRPYHSPEFRDLADRYHEAAVAAHWAKARPEMALPTVADLDALERPKANGDEPGNGATRNGRTRTRRK